MNKRIKRIYVLMLILMIAVSAPVSTLAENIYTSGLYKYKIKGNGTVSIIDFDWNNNTGDLYIPSMLDGYVVSTISEQAFANGNVADADPVLLVLPNTVTIIEEKAFFDSPITSVSIPSSVQSIGFGAFAYCAISQFIVDPNHEYFAAIDGALYDKKNKMLLSYPQNPVSIKPIPNGIVRIDDYAFAGITIGAYTTFDQKKGNIHFTDLLPDTVISIGAHAFENCVLYYDTVDNDEGIEFASLRESVSLMPSSVEEVGEYAFYGCTFRNNSFSRVTEVLLGEGIADIGDRAFQNCRWYDMNEYKLNITGQNRLKRVGNYAFADSIIYTQNKETGLVRIVLPTRIDEIGEYAFSSTHWVDVSNTQVIKALNVGAFKNTIVFSDIASEKYKPDCPCAITIWGNIVNVPDEAFLYSYATPENTIHTLIVVEGIKSIGASAFNGWTWLSNVVLPESLQCIEENAFIGCDNLTTLTLPESVSYIGDNAFQREIITLNVRQDSYAALWASENGYSYQYVEDLASDLDWLTP